MTEYEGRPLQGRRVLVTRRAGQASALVAVLLAVVLVLYAFYHRVFGVDHMRLG